MHMPQNHVAKASIAVNAPPPSRNTREPSDPVPGANRTGGGASFAVTLVTGAGGEIGHGLIDPARIPAMLVKGRALQGLERWEDRTPAANGSG